VRLSDVLDSCGARAVTVAPGTSLAEAAEAMHRAGATAALVVDDEQLRGLLTLGDFLRLLTTAPSPAAAWTHPVTAALTEATVAVAAEEKVAQVIARMTATGIDHLPVAVAGGFVVVSLSNLLRAENAFLHGEVRHLQTYIDALHDAPND
jgi:CBS domain-containing protein